jgi:hypothetical protein
MNSIPFLKSKKSHVAALLTGLLLNTISASATISNANDKKSKLVIYDDLSTFAAAITEIDAGSDPFAAFQRYLDKASPGMQIFTARFDTSAATIAEKFTKYPKYYHYLTTLRSEIEAREAEMLTAIGKLQMSAPAGSKPVPVYLLVANMRAGGNPGVVQTPEGPRPVIGVSIDLMAQSDRVDSVEFGGRPPGLKLTDLPYSVVHEMAHIFQAQNQGMANYRSIYNDPAKSTNLAFAIREGCADFLVWQATGLRFEDRYQFVKAHKKELWDEFSAIADKSTDPTSSWFGPRKYTPPERPMQVGYGLGMQICETYYEAEPDKSMAMKQIYGAYLPEHFKAILTPFAERMSR